MKPFRSPFGVLSCPLFFVSPSLRETVLARANMGSNGNLWARMVLYGNAITQTRATQPWLRFSDPQTTRCCVEIFWINSHEIPHFPDHFAISQVAAHLNPPNHPVVSHFDSEIKLSTGMLPRRAKPRPLCAHLGGSQLCLLNACEDRLLGHATFDQSFGQICIGLSHGALPGRNRRAAVTGQADVQL